MVIRKIDVDLGHISQIDTSFLAEMSAFIRFIADLKTISPFHHFTIFPFHHFPNNSGLRLGELISLKIRDLDLNSEKPFLKIIQSKGKKDRIVPLAIKLIPKLKEYL